MQSECEGYVGREVAVRSSNPVLTRLDDTRRLERRVLGTGGAEAMTVDDVVVRTVGLLLLTGATAAAAWVVVPQAVWISAALAGTALAGLVLALAISLRGSTSPALIVGYAVLQGLLLGVASRAFQLVYPGIVVQAVVGTLGVFLGMSLLYRFRVLRATPRMARLVAGTLLGIVTLSVANLVFYLFTGRQALEVYSLTAEAGWLAYVFSVVAIVAGAFSFILDFDLVERSVRAGLPRRYAWYCAFGLLAGLVFLYWQLLRLLSYLRR
ncbi:Bax inhibitor-1/YccA family protein [Micromonospora olivasterospora]|uniref:Putative YccA/Bax inhibitor family protein n=1 Tax=Micromonospora olivasterospora TaxID=1880 RepID=A0A562ICJ6_MICOL|nr:Bax inhibitor-1/YccA family protein [Micromonospora olivasterospora]TWH68435.1 putative YccA/Bax inhibitor family protein [Micromonospora olivasterospora]